MGVGWDWDGAVMGWDDGGMRWKGGGVEERDRSTRAGRKEGLRWGW